MTNVKDNQEEYEIQKSRVWKGEFMNGTWDGSGIWHKDKQWTGNGTWQGGLLYGTWNGRGSWKPIGEWEGDGDLISNLSFQKSLKMILFARGLVAFVVIALIAVAAIGLISYGFVVVGIVVITSISIVGIIAAKSTYKGKLWVNGRWEDEGESRILNMTGHWKLGGYEGIIEGIMKDPKP